jgi:hypothetical protein
MKGKANQNSFQSIISLLHKTAEFRHFLIQCEVSPNQLDIWVI